jgi:methionyl-tRNA formyltransferase
MMKIGIFANDKVGCEIIKIFAEKKQRLAFLVINHDGDDTINTAIVEAAKDIVKKIFRYKRNIQTAVLSSIKAIQPDLIVLAWWPYIINEQWLRIPQTRWLNVHPSFLPYGRGKDPNFWAIRDREPFGVTIHSVDRGVDTGPIAFQNRIKVHWEDDGRTLYNKATREIVSLFRNNFEKIVSSNIPTIKQEDDKATCHQRCELEEASKINLDSSYQARDLLNLIRARTFPPHPGAWFEENGVKYDVRIKIRRRKQ